MKTKELNKISKRLGDIEVQLRAEYGLNRISGGFVIVDMIDYDDEFIYISIKDGIQSDCTNAVTCDEQRLNRNTLEFNN